MAHNETKLDAQALLLKQDHARLKNIMNSIIPICFAAHLAYVALFYWLNIGAMLRFNLLLSLPVFALAYVLNFKNRESVALAITQLEVALHTAFSIYFVGWEAGFQFLLIAGSVIIFLVYTWSFLIKLIVSVLYVSEYLAIYLLFQKHVAVAIESGVLAVLYIINFLVIVLGIAYAVAHYVILAFSAEAKLAAANANILAQRDKIDGQHRDITASITYASRIQQAILPPDDILRHCLPDSMILFKPRDIVSGDFYWLKQIGDKLYIVAADCTGHGVPGAFMSMLGISLLNELLATNELLAPNVLLDDLRQRIKKSLHQTDENTKTQDGMDIACCLLDLKTKHVQYAGANNPLYLLRGANSGHTSELLEVKADRMPIGIHPKDKIPFSLHELQLERGDAIYIFSDGYVSQFGGESDERFKTYRFKEALLSSCNLSMNDQKLYLDQVFEDWRGIRRQVDDVLVIGIRST